MGLFMNNQTWYVNWKGASQSDLRRLQVIHTALINHPKLIKHLFDSNEPEMHCGRDEMLTTIGCYSSGEQILCKFAIDVWFHPCEKPSCYAIDFLRLDSDNFENVLTALRMLRNL